MTAPFRKTDQATIDELLRRETLYDLDEKIACHRSMARYHRRQADGLQDIRDIIAMTPPVRVRAVIEACQG